MRRPSHVAAIRGIHVGCDVADDVYCMLCVESTLDVTWQMTAVDVEHGGSDMECARVLAL